MGGGFEGGGIVWGGSAWDPRRWVWAFGACRVERGGPVRWVRPGVVRPFGFCPNRGEAGHGGPPFGLAAALGVLTSEPGTSPAPPPLPHPHPPAPLPNPAAPGEGKLFAPGNLRATFDNPAYERLIAYYLGEKYTLR